MKILRATALVTISCVLLTLALARQSVAQGDQSQLPAVGTMAPNFTLNSQEGTPVSLKQFRGRWVVLYFYPKDMTRGCTIEAHGFQADQAKYRKIDAVVLGVSVDTVASHREFCAKDGLNFKLLSDTSHAVVSRYGCLTQFRGMTLAARTTFLINPRGMIVKEFVKVNPTGHSGQVLAALAALQHSA